MSRLHKVSVSTIQETRTFKITRLNGAKIEAVLRKADDKEFEIGEFVANGTKMPGKITGFEIYLVEDTGEVTISVSHTWSGIGMSLESIRKVKAPLPSKFQHGDIVCSDFPRCTIRDAKIIKIHFTIGARSQYDLEVPISTDNSMVTRLYNVDEMILKAQ